MRENELNSVLDFQKAMEVDMISPGVRAKDLPTAALNLNHKINHEEIKETLQKGVQGNDLEQIADGCGDTIYTIAHAVNQLGRTPNAGRDAAATVLLHDAMTRIDYALGGLVASDEDLDRNLSIIEIVMRGIAATYEIPLDKVFAEIHRSNMTKLFPDGKCRKNEFGKVMKPPGYSKPDIKKILNGKA